MIDTLPAERPTTGLRADDRYTERPTSSIEPGTGREIESCGAEMLVCSSESELAGGVAARADGDTTYDYQDGYQPAEREGFSSPLHVRDASEVPVQQ
jgi:hypothetical protein